MGTVRPSGALNGRLPSHLTIEQLVDVARHSPVYLVPSNPVLQRVERLTGAAGLGL